MGDGAVSLFDRIGQARRGFTQLREEADTTAKEVEASAERIQRATERLGTMTDRAIGDLRSYLAQLDSGWAIELEQQLDLVELGGQRLDAFIGKFGNLVLTTETGTERIRELLDGIDPRQFENQVQDLIRQAKQGGDALSEMIDLIRSKGGQLTASLLASIEAFERGEGTIERILRNIEQIKEVTGGGTTLDSLLEELARELAESNRDGGIQ